MRTGVPRVLGGLQRCVSLKPDLQEFFLQRSPLRLIQQFA
jgi:hypothetical protein